MLSVHMFYKKHLLKILFISGVLLCTSYTFAFLKQYESLEQLFFIVVAILCGIPILTRAISGLRYKVVGIELLVSIAVIGALFIHEYSEAGMVTFLFQLGSYLEIKTLEKTRNSIRLLTDMTPSTAILIRDGKQEEIHAEDVELDDLLFVKSGDRIAVDGIVAKGDGYVNEASITGEARLSHKKENDLVFAGTILDSGLIEMRAKRVGEDTTFAKIIHLVEEAQDAKSPAEQFIDRFARWYTPFVAIVAFLIWLFTKDIELSITMLVLACPGALVIGAPVASVAGIGRGAKESVLLKGGDSIHTFAKCNVMVFDKTGTITKGKTSVSKRIYFEDDEDELDVVCALAEGTSNHPIAKAIQSYALSKQLSLQDDVQLIENEKGMGLHVHTRKQDVLVGNLKLMKKHNISISQEHTDKLVELQKSGASILLLVRNKKMSAMYAISDIVKEDAQETMKSLRRQGIKKLVMLSGDHQDSANYVADKVHMDEAYGNLLPQDKVAFVKKLQAEGNKVAFVGDGINDSPAIVCADIGIAMGSGTDVAIETSDIVLVKSTLSSLLKSLQLSKRIVLLTQQNIAIAIGTVILLLIGLFAGYIHMASGMFIHELSIVLVILNAMRLLYTKEYKKRKESRL